MSDYISREDAIQAYEDSLHGKGSVYGLIGKIPSADVRENIKGEWIVYPGGYACSNCRRKSRKSVVVFMKAYPYCPECGCKMRVREKKS